MNTIVILFLALVSAFLTPAAFAANQWSAEFTPTGIQSGGYGDHTFILSGPVNFDTSCQGSKTLFYFRSGYNGQTADSLKSTLAIALGAYLGKKKVKLYYDNSSNACYVNMMTVSD